MTLFLTMNEMAWSSRKNSTLKGSAQNIKINFSNIKNVKIKSVKNFSFRCDCYNACFLHFFKRSCRIRPLYHGIFVQRHRPPADRVYQSDEQRVRRCIPPAIFDLREDGSLKLNYLSPFLLLKSMHDKGIKVVPFFKQPLESHRRDQRLEEYRVIINPNCRLCGRI